MAIIIRLPGNLSQWTGGQRQVKVQSDSVAGAIQSLCSDYPAVGQRVLDEQGLPQRFVNIYVNGEDVRLLQGTETHLDDGDEVIIAPAVAGG